LGAEAQGVAWRRRQERKGDMRKVFAALIAIAIVSAACSAALTPTPSRVPSSDETYLLYIGGIAPNEMLAYTLVAKVIAESIEEGPFAPCEWNDELEDTTWEFKYALERSPQPLHPSLKKHRECLLEAMEMQLDITSRLDEACASGDLAQIGTASLFQEGVTTLLECAGDALDAYERSQLGEPVGEPRQEGPSDIVWQQSQSVLVELGVRDKYGRLGSYNALFVVTSPDGNQYRTKRRLSGDEFGYVYFPHDFGTYAKPGTYSWECIVGGNAVVSGRFEYKSVDGYSDQARVLVQ